MLNYVPKVISYESVPPRKLTLEVTGDQVRIIFPTWPKILYLFNALGFSLAALLTLLIGLAILYTRLVLQPKYSGSSSMSPDDLKTLISMGLTFGFWGTMSLFHWRYYYCWDQQNCILYADPKVIVKAGFFLWNRRERQWATKDLSAIELRPARGHLWGKPRMLLYVHRHQKRPLRFYLFTTDPLLPQQIATSLARVLACELRLPQIKSISQT